MLEARPLGRIRFQLLGQAGLFGGNANTAVRVSTQKGFALLAYLAMNAGRPVSRAVLADLLWGDRSEAQARQSLRQAILTLRRDLGAAGSASLNADDQSLSLAVEADDVDALQFAACAASADPARRQRCLEMPWAPFLDNLSVGVERFDEWVIAERHRLDAVATRVFSDLARQFDEAGDGERAILAMERLIAIDSVDEERHRRLLVLEARYRGADAALARGRELAAMLEREVDAEQEPATIALIDDIKRKRKPVADIRAQADRDATYRPVPQIDATAAIATGDTTLSLSPGPRWMLRTLPGGRTARVLASLALIGACAAAIWVAVDNWPHQKAIVTPSADPWQSPPLPSGRLLSGGANRNRIIPIVVLPFKTYQDVESVRMLADMMTDDLTNTLSRVRNFRVISRQTARAYQARQIDVSTAGKELDVRYALEGSMREHDGKLRVAVELTDTANRTVVWSARIEREKADRHAVQDEIVARLARELRNESFEIESARRSNDPDADALAYRGMAAVQAALVNVSPEAFNKAQALFVQALQRDPQNTMARLGLSSFHVTMAGSGLAPNGRAHFEQAREILTTLTRENPTISAAHFLFGMTLVDAINFPEAVQAFERALELDHSNAGAYAWLGFTLALMGKPQEGLEHIRYALRLSPKDPSLAFWLQFAGSAELEVGHSQEAIAYFQRSTALTPGYPRPWAGLAAAQALTGDLDAARISLERLRALAPTLTAQQIYRRFGRTKSKAPRLQEGLWRALTEPAAAPRAERSWQSPPLPSTAADDSIARGRGLVAIAVLPFRLYSENGNGSALVADMVTEDLTYLLSRVPLFRVISHQTASAYRDQGLDAGAIGAELGVQYLVEGNVSQHGSSLRVSVALVDARTRLQIWTGRFERTGDDRHALQTEIVNGLARELQISVSAVETSRTSNNPDVHELIFRGFAAIQGTRLHGVDALRPAEAYFQKALERDPNAIRAQIGLGAFHAHMAVQLFAPDPAPHLAKAESILRQVIDRHPNVSEAYQPMGLVHVARRQMKKAKRMFERAIELNPSDAPSHAQFGRALVSLGDPQAGLAHIRYAMQLSPRDPVLGYWIAFAGYACVELGRYDEAVDYLSRAHATNPTQPRTLLTYIAALGLAGRMAEARLKLEQLQQVHPHLTREALQQMYEEVGGRVRTTEGIRRVLAVENSEHSAATK